MANEKTVSIKFRVSYKIGVGRENRWWFKVSNKYIPLSICIKLIIRTSRFQLFSFRIKMQSSTSTPSDAVPSVELKRLALAFHLENVSCSKLNEYFAEAYKPFKREFETILLKRNCTKVVIYFMGVFLEDRWDCNREIEHYFDHRSADKWVYNIKDVEDCYNSFTAEVYRKIADILPADVYSHSFDTRVFTIDLDDDLD